MTKKKKKEQYNFEKKKKRKLSPSRYKQAVENLKLDRASKRNYAQNYQQTMKIARPYLTASQIHKEKLRKQKIEAYNLAKIKQAKIAQYKAYKKEYSTANRFKQNISQNVSNQYNKFSDTNAVAMQRYGGKDIETGNKISKATTGIFSALTNMGGSIIEKIGARGRPVGSLSGKYISPFSGQPTDVNTYKREIQQLKQQRNIAQARAEYQQRMQNQNQNQHSLQNGSVSDPGFNADALANDSLNSDYINPDYINDSQLQDQEQQDFQQSMQTYQQPSNPKQQRANRNLQRARYLNSRAIARGKQPLYKENDLREGNGFGLKSSYKINFGHNVFQNKTPFRDSKPTANLMKNERQFSDEEIEFRRLRQQQGLALTNRTENRFVSRTSRQSS
jgi:hypothetical protein